MFSIVAESSATVTVEAYEESFFNVKMKVDSPALWDIDDPTLAPAILLETLEKLNSKSGSL